MQVKIIKAEFNEVEVKGKKNTQRYRNIAH